MFVMLLAIEVKGVEEGEPEELELAWGVMLLNDAEALPDKKPEEVGREDGVANKVLAAL